MEQTYNPSTQEAETEIKILSSPWLHSKFNANLGSMKFSGRQAGKQGGKEVNKEGWAK